MNGYGVGWCVYGWFHKSQSWRRLKGLYDSPLKAREVAEIHHKKIRKQLEVIDEVVEAQYVLQYWELGWEIDDEE